MPEKTARPQLTQAARWSADQVLALAPDASAQRAGASLGTPAPWRDTGYGEDPPSVWGYCRGSGTTPYRTCVDLTGPAYRCSCPSRKIPCKHAIGLLLLWAAGQVATAPAPQWVSDWHAERAGRQQKAATRTEARARRADDGGGEAAARTQARRAARVEAGVEELDRWLSDQVRQGIAGAGRAGYQHWDAMAARLVDAQAPGLASGVRRLAAVAGAPDRLLTELSLLRLVVSGHRRRHALPEDLAATVRGRIGFPVSSEEVLAREPVPDEWCVVGVRDEIDERLNLRRVWLHGVASGRDALILTFAPPGTPLPADLVLGTRLEADLCFFPGRGNMRALVRTRRAEPGTFGSPPGAAATIAEALGRYAEALAADPWLERWPMLLGGVTLAPREAAEGDGWRVLDGAGCALPLNTWAAPPWRLHAAGGGAPATLFGEWTTAGLRVLTMWTNGRLVRP